MRTRFVYIPLRDRIYRLCHVERFTSEKEAYACERVVTARYTSQRVRTRAHAYTEGNECDASVT